MSSGFLTETGVFLCEVGVEQEGLGCPEVADRTGALAGRGGCRMESVCRQSGGDAAENRAADS